MFNPFEHWDELPRTNIHGGELFGIPRPDTIALPDGQVIPTYIPFQPESITHWLKGSDGAYHQITAEQSFAQALWLHFAYGMELGAPSPEVAAMREQAAQQLGTSYKITAEALLEAIATMPTNLSDILQQYTAQEIVAYAVHEAPDIVIVGIA